MLQGGIFVHPTEAAEIKPRLVYSNKAENNTFRVLTNLIQEGRLYTKVSGSLFRYSMNVTMQELSEHTLYVELKEHGTN